MIAARVRLGKGWGFSPSYQLSRHRNGQVETIQVSLSQSPGALGCESDPATPIWQADPRQPLGGIVFEDRDGDGVQGESEPGVPGIGLLVDNDRPHPIYTDAGGRYRCLVRPGAHLVRILAETVPTCFGLRDLREREVTVNSESPARCSFHLHRQGGGVAGRVVRISSVGIPNPVGVSSDGGVSGVKVILDGSDFTYTDADGYFSFRSLAAGTYQIAVDTATLPFGHLVTDAPVRLIMVEEPGEGAPTAGAPCVFTISRSVRQSTF
jgi:hypothetical protein